MRPQTMTGDTGNPLGSREVEISRCHTAGTLPLSGHGVLGSHFTHPVFLRNRYCLADVKR